MALPYVPPGRRRSLFLGVDLFEQREQGRALPNGFYGFRLSNNDDGSQFEVVHCSVWPPTNLCLYSELWWAPSFGRDSNMKERSGLTPNMFDKTVSQCHNLVLGYVEHHGQEVDDEPIPNREVRNVVNKVQRWRESDINFNKEVERHFAVYGPNITINKAISHQYVKHGRRGGFTFLRYIHLLMHINAKYNLQQLLSDAGCMPPEGGRIEIALGMLIQRLRAVFGARPFIKLAVENGTNYLKSMELLFLFDGSPRDNLKTYSVSLDVVVCIESIESRHADEGF